MFLNCELCEALKSLKDWTLVGSFAVGGFEYMGFSISDSNKLVVISSTSNDMYFIPQVPMTCDAISVLAAFCLVITTCSGQASEETIPHLLIRCSPQCLQQSLS